MIRYLATIYGEIILVCINENYENLRLLFSDILNIITFFKVTEHSDPNHNFLINGFKNKMIHDENINIFFTGSYAVEGPKPVKDYPFSWYDDVNIDTSVFWDYTYIPKTKINDQVYDIVKNMKYVFIHSTCSGGLVFTTTEMEERFNIDRNNILFINPCVNIYPKNHKFYDIAEKFLAYKLCDYIKLIEKAEYIFVADSSFFGMCHHLENIQTDNVYYFNRDLDYQHLYSDKYKSNNKKLKRFKRLNVNNENRCCGTWKSHMVGGTEEVKKFVNMDIKE